jgi:hypothetical protein
MITLVINVDSPEFARLAGTRQVVLQRMFPGLASAHGDRSQTRTGQGAAGHDMSRHNCSIAIARLRGHTAFRVLSCNNKTNRRFTQL